MKFKLSVRVQKDLKSYRIHNPKLVEKVGKQLTLFSSNHKHPSLRTHKLSGNLGESWSISLDRNWRMLYTVLPGEVAYFYLIGTHDEVYKK